MVGAGLRAGIVIGRKILYFEENRQRFTAPENVPARRPAPTAENPLTATGELNGPALVVATMNSDDGSPRLRAWAARITSQSSESGLAVGIPEFLDRAQSLAAVSRCASEMDRKRPGVEKQKFRIPLIWLVAPIRSISRMTSY